MSSAVPADRLCSFLRFELQIGRMIPHIEFVSQASYSPSSRIGCRVYGPQGGPVPRFPIRVYVEPAARVTGSQDAIEESSAKRMKEVKNHARVLFQMERIG